MGSLVEQHFEHVGWLEVECFASKEDLATRSAVGNPLATPPVAELRQPSSFHPRAEHDDGIGYARVRGLNGSPAGFKCGDEP